MSMSSSHGVKMPHNNRVSSSVSLKMNDIWTKTIGYDPYGAENETANDEQNERAAGLLLLAKMSNLSGSETRGACSRCGMVGHLTFQCRNEPKGALDSELSSDSSSSEEEPSRSISKNVDGPVDDSMETRKSKKRSRKDSKKESKKKSKKSKKKSRKSEK